MWNTEKTTIILKHLLTFANGDNTQSKYDCSVKKKHLHETLFPPQWVQHYTAYEQPVEASKYTLYTVQNAHCLRKGTAATFGWYCQLNIVCNYTILTLQLHEWFYLLAEFQAL